MNAALSLHDYSARRSAADQTHSSHKAMLNGIAEKCEGRYRGSLSHMYVVVSMQPARVGSA